MNKEQPGGSNESLLKLLSEIAGLTAGIIGYFVSLFGLMKGQYSKTAAVLTLVLTTVFLVRWRWRGIAERKEKKGKGTKSKTTSAHFFDPLRSATAEFYRLPLPRRRIEATVLGILSLFTLVRTGIQLPAVVSEWTKVPDLACHTPDENAKYRVVVASLNQYAEQKLVIADRIFDELVTDSAGNLYTVCRLDQVLENSDDVEKAILAYEADVLIWGRSDVQGYEIHLRVPRLSESDRNASNVSIEEAASYSFQQVEPENVSFISQFTLTELLILEGRFDEGKARLEQILIGADQIGVRKENIADGYYLLGLYYDPYFSPDADIQKAVATYSQAIENDSTLFEAWVNRGSLYMDLGQKELAFADFSYLIEHGSREYEGMAYINRADLQKDPEAAKADLDAAVKADPELGHYYRGLWYLKAQEYALARDDLQQAIMYNAEVYLYYEYLGIAQLHTGDEEAARQTFSDMVPYLTGEDRESVIADLEAEGNAYRNLQAGIDAIIEDLKSAEIP